jgi:hypothetical protein
MESKSSDLIVRGVFLVLIVAAIVFLHRFVTKSRGAQSTEKFLMGAPLVESKTKDKGGADKGVMASDGIVNADQYQRVDGLAPPFPKDCFTRDTLKPSDLLPANVNSEFGQMNPLGQGDIANRNFLSAGFHVGIDTQGSSLRNANLQLRSEPPNPRRIVSPWSQSTIETDVNRRPLEIGGSCA